MQTIEDTPRERLRRALVGLAQARLTNSRHDAASSSGTKGPEAGEPASGQGPSEPRGVDAPELGSAALSEGREEGGTPAASRTTTSS